MGRHVFLHEVVDCPLVSGGYCLLFRPPLPLKIVRFIPPPIEVGESSYYVLKESIFGLTDFNAKSDDYTTLDVGTDVSKVAVFINKTKTVTVIG